MAFRSKNRKVFLIFCKKSEEFSFFLTITIIGEKKSLQKIWYEKEEISMEVTRSYRQYEVTNVMKRRKY